MNLTQTSSRLLNNKTNTRLMLVSGMFKRTARGSLGTRLRSAPEIMQGPCTGWSTITGFRERVKRGARLATRKTNKNGRHINQKLCVAMATQPPSLDLGEGDDGIGWRRRKSVTAERGKETGIEREGDAEKVLYDQNRKYSTTLSPRGSVTTVDGAHKK